MHEQVHPCAHCASGFVCATCQVANLGENHEEGFRCFLCRSKHHSSFIIIMIIIIVSAKLSAPTNYDLVLEGVFYAVTSHTLASGQWGLNFQGMCRHLKLYLHYPCIHRCRFDPSCVFHPVVSSKLRLWKSGGVNQNSREQGFSPVRPRTTGAFLCSPEDVRQRGSIDEHFFSQPSWFFSFCCLC